MDIDNGTLADCTNQDDGIFLPVYRELRENGACALCSYRFLCNSQLYTPLDHILTAKGYEQNDHPPEKLSKTNTCVICLGLFDEKVLEEAADEISKEMTTMEFDCDSYMLALILPVSCKLREHSTFMFLKSKFPDLYKNCPFAPRLGMKEAWRFYANPRISSLIGKTMDAKSVLIVQLTFSYANDLQDYEPIARIIKKNSLKKNLNFSCSLKLLDESNFVELYPFPMSVPDDRVHIKNTTIRRDSIFFAGRYNKFSRKLSQTPWFLADGERKMELSVEEIISNILKDFTKADDSKFASSGREDVDVRMLGNGRPFTVELINPRISNVPFDKVRKLENEINEAGTNLIFIRDLQIVNRTELANLRSGEENKTKNYSCLCKMRRKCDINHLRSLLPTTPFVIQQKTPIRVLHRRTVATRPKTIFELSCEVVNLTSSEDCTVFKLNLKTESGTYIKEFVHGDFGRTQPNISTLFDDIPIDVLALDVTNVAVDWPPPVAVGPI